MMRAVACGRLLRLHHQPLDMPESEVVKLRVLLDRSNEVLRLHLPRCHRRLSDKHIRPSCARQRACAYQPAWAGHAGLDLMPKAQLHDKRDQSALDDIDVLDRISCQPKYVFRVERPHPTFDLGKTRCEALRGENRYVA